MSIQWTAKSETSYSEVEGSLYRGSHSESSLGVIRVTGGSELLLTAAELRELATVATQIADQIEAAK